MLRMHRSSLRSARAGTIAAILSLMVVARLAQADQDPAASNASDFYVRAGLGLDWSKDTRFMDRDCASTEPAAIYGCGAGSDGEPLGSAGDFGTMAGVEAGVGYIVSPRLRVEGTIQYRPHFSFDGRSNFLQDGRLGRTRTVRADLSSVSAMLAAYLDLRELGRFRPFVGGGLGLSRIRIDETRMQFRGSNTTTVVPGGRRTGLAWMLTAGVATPVGEGTTLDLAWRYADFGTVETGRGGGVACRIETCSFGEFLELDFAPTQADLRTHGLSISVRYAF